MSRLHTNLEYSLEYEINYTTKYKKNGVQLHNNDGELGYCIMNVLDVFQ